MNHVQDRVIAAWLREGPDAGPEEGLRRALAATRSTSQRPAWAVRGWWLPADLGPRPLTGPRLAPIIALTLLLVAMMAAALFVGSQPRLPTPTGPAANGVIAYSWNGKIMGVDPTGTARRELFPDLPAPQRAPSFSPDGTRVAFWTGNGRNVVLTVATLDGSWREVASFSSGTAPAFLAPEWSPDGEHLAFTLTDGTLGVVRSTGDDPVRTLGDQTRERLEPRWSFDGRWIAFRWRDDREIGIGVVHPDGTNERDLVSEARPENEVEVDRFHQGYVWAPDAAVIAYQWYTDVGAGEVGTVDVDGARATLADSPVAEFNPAWSPDGRVIAFLAYSGNDGSVELVDRDGTNRRTLVNQGLFCRLFWSPDGKLLVGSPQEFNCTHSDSRRLRAVRIEDPTNAYEVATGVNGLPTWQRLPPP